MPLRKNSREILQGPYKNLREKQQHQENGLEQGNSSTRFVCFVVVVVVVVVFPIKVIERVL